ncbi:MAG: hypothetical protein ACLFNQ_06425 [Spirochaetaceae bacterium]
MIVSDTLQPEDLRSSIDTVFAVADRSTENLHRYWDPSRGAPVFTEKGIYTTRGWTEWTQGFQFGNQIYLYDALGRSTWLDRAREAVVRLMYPHLTHTGVHDHGFNNVSTYGNLLRLMKEGRIDYSEWEAEYYRLALRVTGAVQAARFTRLPGGLGYVPSFNGAHSLFSDTIRSMRALAVSHRLGGVLIGEQDERVNLLTRIIVHAETTARYNVYYGTGRDTYDVRGRVVHESLFNVESGSYRAPSSQQGYSPFTTWTRGHAWVLCGYPELLEFLDTIDASEYEGPEYLSTLDEARTRFTDVARAAADFYLEHTPTDGIPYWDTGAPGLVHLGDWRAEPADPFNSYEPVDSSSAAIAAQGLLRLGRYLMQPGRDSSETELGRRYYQAGLTAANTLFQAPYLPEDTDHQGILLHSVYHRPNGWDYEPDQSRVPRGESCMWGDYHLLELALYVKREIEEGEYLVFFNV